MNPRPAAGPDSPASQLRRNAASAGMEPFDVFNDVQDHVLRTAQVHIDRVVREAFVAGIE